MGLFNKTKSKINKVYLDNAGSFSFKENLGKELTFQKLKISGTSNLPIMKFLKKVKSKTTALSKGDNYELI